MPLHFTVLSLTGVWCPLGLSSRFERTLYNLYSCFIIAVMCSLAFSQLARIVLVRQSFTEFNDTFFILLSTNFACFKAACDLLNQRHIIHLLEMFEESYCLAKNDVEKIIQRKYDDFCRKIEIILLTLVEMCALMVVVAPLFSSESLDLPYKVLLPYDLSNPLLYWLTFAHHALGAVLFPAVSIMNDTMITGFMLQVCGQLDILQQRLAEMPRRVAKAIEANKSGFEAKILERMSLMEIVRHQVHIFGIAKTICTTFSGIISCQFCISALEICVSVYQLAARTNNTVELVTCSLYLTCMLGQFFAYCYFGNEVTIHSKSMSEAIMGTDWTSLSVELKKDLVIVLLRSSKPIKMSCGAFIHLTLESFTTIVKTSYSAFTVLKTSI